MQEIHECTSGFEIIPLKKIYERKWCHAIMMHDVLYSTYSVWGIDLSNQSESPWMISPGTSSQTFTRRSNERWILYVQVCSFHYIQLSFVQNADCKFTELPTVSHPLFPESTLSTKIAAIAIGPPHLSLLCLELFDSSLYCSFTNISKFLGKVRVVSITCSTETPPKI